MLYNRINLIKECCDFIKSCQTQGVGYCLYNYKKVYFYMLFYDMLKCSDKYPNFDVDFNFTVEDFYNYVISEYSSPLKHFNPNGMCKLLSKYKMGKRVEVNLDKIIEDLHKKVRNEDCVKL